MKYELIRAKSLLSKPMVADSWFHINRSLNAYRGCEHACTYCDGMSESYYVDDFLTHIRIKENAPTILRRELKKEGFTSQTELETETLWPFMDKADAERLAMKSPRKQVIGVCGGVSDGYQPAEKENRITRQVLEVLLDYGMPVFVLTKSDLVLRDLDLLKEIHEKAFSNIVFTITLHDDEKRKVFEPKASSTTERFDALREIRKAGLFGGVMATPMIPGVGDTHDNIEGLVKESKRVGAEFILFGGMTLKPGRQKQHFMSVLRNRFPEHPALIERIYQNEDKYGTPLYKLLPVNVMHLGYKLCKKHGIRDRSVRHRIPYEHDSNNAVLGIVLDIIFRQNFMLGFPWHESKPFRELAERIERGVEELNGLREDGVLSSRLHIDNGMTQLVEEILDTGSCHHLESLHEQLDEITVTL